VSQHGTEKTQDYIGRLDRHIAKTGRQYKGGGGHFAVITDWIAQDSRAAPHAPHGHASALPHAKKPMNRFLNFKQREWDYEELERLAQLELTRAAGLA